MLYDQNRTRVKFIFKTFSKIISFTSNIKYTNFVKYYSFVFSIFSNMKEESRETYPMFTTSSKSM